MSRKKTHEEYIEEILSINPNIKVVEQYIDIKTPILHRCLAHNVVWNISPECVLRGCGCPDCKKEKTRQRCKKTHEKYVSEVYEINSNIKVIGQYVNARIPIEHYCMQHDVFWNALPYNVLLGCGCPKCGLEKSGAANRKSHEEYVKEVEIENPNIEVIGQYQNAIMPILHRCKIDGCEWMAIPNNILSKSGCPQCNESHGERQIRKWLDNCSIDYVPQKTFDDCKNKKTLPFDFYLPTYNLCIEYDGEQHFRPVEHFGGEKGFQQRKQNDLIKTSYCKDNNIHLLRIPYFKDVKEELEKFFIHLI